MEPSEIFAAPNNLFNITLAVTSMRMSHEVFTPYLMDVTQGKCVFYPGSLWDAWDIAWTADSQTVGMNIRHYSNGRHSMRLELAPEKQTAKLTFEEKTLFSGTFERVEKKMSDVFEIDDEIHPPLFKKLLG